MAMEFIENNSNTETDFLLPEVKAEVIDEVHDLCTEVCTC